MADGLRALFIVIGHGRDAADEMRNKSKLYEAQAMRTRQVVSAMLRFRDMFEAVGYSIGRAG